MKLSDREEFEKWLNTDIPKFNGELKWRDVAYSSVDVWQAALASVQPEIDALKAQVDRLGIGWDGATAEAKMLGEENAELRAANKDLQFHFDVLTSNHGEAVKMLGDALNNAQAWQAAIASVQPEIDAKDMEIAARSNHIKNIESSNDNLRHKIKALESDLAPLPPAVPDIDWLSNVIRHADGSHTMGAGMLAEKIIEAMLAAAKGE